MNKILLAVLIVAIALVVGIGLILERYIPTGTNQLTQIPANLISDGGLGDALSDLGALP